MKQVHVFFNRSRHDNKQHAVSFVAFYLPDDHMQGYQEITRSTFMVPAHQASKTDVNTICETVRLEAHIKLKLPLSNITINIHQGGK